MFITVVMSKLKNCSQELVMLALSTLLIPLVMHAVFILVLAVNVYCFSEKIFHLAAYKRIL